jgi:hypothetical protein
MSPDASVSAVGATGPTTTEGDVSAINYSEMPATGSASQSRWLTGGIFDDEPQTWLDLQNYVAQLFHELGFQDVKSPHKLVGIRTTKEVDVYAVDASAVPPIRIACECKNWNSAVPQGVVLEFRSVLEDSGINRGFVISKLGFQSGARDAAKNTPIVLLSFEGLTQLFFDAWLKAMSARLDRLSRLLFPFFDIYWFETLPKLAEDKFPRFGDLKEKYWVLFTLGTRLADRDRKQISIAITAANKSVFEPFINLGITTYRQFFDILLAMADEATLEFCSLFEITAEQLRRL